MRLSDERNTLYIPINIKTNMEFFEGFGMKELMKTATAVLIAGSVALVLYLMGAISLVTLIVINLSSAGGGVIFTVKDRSNLSVYDQIVLMIRFSRANKKYPYIYMDEWRKQFD